MKGLIINADDLGLTPLINRAVVRSVREGCVRSATVLTGAPAFMEAVEALSGLEGVSLGIHLNLTGTWDAGPGPKGRGFFSGRPGPLLRACLAGQVHRPFAEEALRRQIEAFLARGITPTHLDGHHHVHVFPGIASLAARLAAEYRIPFCRIPAESWPGLRNLKGSLAARAVIHFMARRAAPLFRRFGLVSPDRFSGIGLAGRRDFKRCFHGILSRLECGITEVMTHPGPKEDDRNPDLHARGRHVETEALIAQETRDLIKRLGIRLLSYHDLDPGKPREMKEGGKGITDTCR